jgi:hypothetical protein
MDTNLPRTVQNSITVGSAEGSSQPHNCVHGEPYFDDGNIILQAGSTHFKVYRGILSAHSEVFRAMFTIPQPANEIISDGCSIVRLSDSAKDWHHVLHALYLGRSVPLYRRLLYTVIQAISTGTMIPSRSLKISRFLRPFCVSEPSMK